jgi:hypothetical protein
MSIRRAPQANLGVDSRARQLQRQIENLREASAMAEQTAPCMGAAMAGSREAAALFDSLSETEKSAATIGAGPDEWKPIGWMNTSHYSTLLKKNALGSRLTQQIEAYKLVSTTE